MQSLTEKQKQINIIFLGPPGVGKSCLVNGFTPQYKTTIGVDLTQKTISVKDHKQVKFVLWDISASMTFLDKNLEHCKKGDIIALVFDLNNSDSFKELQSLAQKLVTEDRIKYNSKFVIIGNKSDLERNVDYNLGYEAGQVLKGDTSSTQSYFEVSSKTDQNALQKLCDSFYKVHTDLSYSTVADLNQQMNPQSTAPTQVYQTSKVTVSAMPVPPPEYDKLFKLLLLGDQNIGKSSILKQFTDGIFLTQYMPTIGVDFGIRTLQLHGVRAKLQIWDTAGMKKFQSITKAYILGCSILLIVFDCTNRKSYQSLLEHMELINKNGKNVNEICKFVVANKIDKYRQVSKEQAQNFAQAYGYQYFQVSAMDGESVNQLFYTVLDWTIKNQIPPQNK